MRTKLYIAVDTNDADYVGRLTDISDISDEDMASLVKIATVVSKKMVTTGHQMKTKNQSLVVTMAS